MDVAIGLYDDVGMASLPGTISMMGNTFMMDHITNISNKRSRGYATSSSSSSAGESYVDEKKMMERERNRLQARKSRTLKKQCTEKLQQQLSQLREQAEESRAKDAEEAKEIADRRHAWRKVLRKVFDLRAEGCIDDDQWLTVISPDLRLTMPITPYRSFNPADVVNNRRVLLGVDGIVSDTQSLKVTRDNIGIKTRYSESPVSIRYYLGCDGHETDDDGSEAYGSTKGDANAFYNENGLMCTFHMSTLDAVAHGARGECEKHGMIRASFSADNKIKELDITFDPISVYHQLMVAAGKKDFPVVPNTLSNALKDESSCIVVTTARRPFRITHVNAAWTNLCGFDIEECKGKSLSILQGPETDMSRVDDLCKLSQKGYASSMVVTNHNKKGELFRNHLRCYPVSSKDPEEISHIVGVLTSIPGESKKRIQSSGPMPAAVQAC